MTYLNSYHDVIRKFVCFFGTNDIDYFGKGHFQEFRKNLTKCVKMVCCHHQVKGKITICNLQSQLERSRWKLYHLSVGCIWPLGQTLETPTQTSNQLLNSKQVKTIEQQSSERTGAEAGLKQKQGHTHLFNVLIIFFVCYT